MKDGPEPVSRPMKTNLVAGTASGVVAALLLVAGCASAPPPAEPPRSGAVSGLVPIDEPAPSPVPASGAEASAGPAAAAVPAPAANPTAPCNARSPTGGLRRSALSRTLDAGLGTWLRGVDVEPKIERGRFQGWSVRSIYAGDPCWADVDIHPGDVVSRVNHHPIERPEQAQAVWNGLRGAGEIVVELIRVGRARTLRFPVVDDGP